MEENGVAIDDLYSFARPMLDKIQQLSIDRVMFAPVYDFRALMGVGPRIAKHTIGEVYLDPFPEYEDIEIKG